MNPTKGTPLHLYWFSGSGNTLRAAETFAERLRRLDWNVELRALERSDPKAIDPKTMLGLAFPTHCFAIPELVLSFVRSLPQVDGSAALMLGTHGAFSGGVVGPMKRELTAKGFHCVAARILSMPDSFWPFFGNATNQKHLERALVRTERYAEEVAAGTARWTRWPVFSDLHAALFGGFFASRKLFRAYHTTVHAQDKRCIRCDTCVRSCPVNALSKIPDAPPRPKRNCTNCLRCVAVCPVDAMRHLVGFRPYRSEEAVALKCRFEKEIEQ